MRTNTGILSQNISIVRSAYGRGCLFGPREGKDLWDDCTQLGIL